MKGFLQDFILLNPDLDEEKQMKYLHCYDEKLAPVLNILAKNYAVCDEVWIHLLLFFPSYFIEFLNYQFVLGLAEFSLFSI